MIFKFRIISDENETFLRTIEISEKDSFLSLHNAIQASCKYDNTQMASFFISNNDWDKLEEITLFDMMDDSIKTVPMNKAILHDYAKAIEDKIIYSFDFFADRSLFLTLMEIKKEDPKVTYPICSHSTGNPPLQLLNDEDEFSQMFNDLETGEDMSEFDDFEDEESKEDFDEFDEFGGGNIDTESDY